MRTSVNELLPELIGGSDIEETRSLSLAYSRQFRKVIFNVGTSPALLSLNSWAVGPTACMTYLMGGGRFPADVWTTSLVWTYPCLEMISRLSPSITGPPASSITLARPPAWAKYSFAGFTITSVDCLIILPWYTDTLRFPRVVNSSLSLEDPFEI